ncbi:thioredoxin-like protein [Aulographum hederae CBS 113979]|uniref:Thioredoxin-like protein n=1 Tax=Aulographum hederae CBS 113979 TaxID=1176131 RepID=A0A6G1GK66_9PEZI|nr:thioredoxin-like protein [Aulographum hederae CBS 113979]
MVVIDVTIVSDPSCALGNCYIGSRRLQKAISLYQKTYPGGSKDTFNISYKPYILRPDAPTEGVQHGVNSMIARMGLERATSVKAHMHSIGASEGIAFNLEVQWEVAQELFRLQFEEDGDVTSMETLVATGKVGGLAEEEVQRWLGEGRAREVVERESAEVKGMGITSVPMFLFGNGAVTVDGAADVGEFFETIVKTKRAASEGFEN